MFLFDDHRLIVFRLNQLLEFYNEDGSPSAVPMQLEDSLAGPPDIWAEMTATRANVAYSSSAELETYTTVPTVVQRELDILSWWKSHTSEYPRLSLVARNVLAIPASNIPSESVSSPVYDLSNMN